MIIRIKKGKMKIKKLNNIFITNLEYFWETFVKNGEQCKRVYKELLNYDYPTQKESIAISYDDEGFSLFDITWIGKKAIRLEFTGTAK